MSVYALKDVDWPWDDEDEGRAIVVCADTPEEAVRIATEKHLAEHPGAGGVTWDVARLNKVAFGDASWEGDNKPVFAPLTYYSDGINGLPDRPPETQVVGRSSRVNHASRIRVSSPGLPCQRNISPSMVVISSQSSRIR